MQTKPGLKGVVFEVDGRVAGVCGTDWPPMDGGIRFEVVGLTAAGERSPAWAEVLVAGEKRVRVNPELSLFRLYDVVRLAADDWSKFPSPPMWGEVTLPPAPHPKSEVIRFTLCKNVPPGPTLLVDTKERQEEFAVN